MITKLQVSRQVRLLCPWVLFVQRKTVIHVMGLQNRPKDKILCFGTPV